MLRLSALIGLGAFLSLALSACLYDDNHRCGPQQHIISNDRCACDDGYVPGDTGCVPCADNERASNGACVCVDGYARASDGAACEPIPATLGVDCDTKSTPCAGDTYALCHATDGTSGYCTNACTTSDDCDGGYKCHEDGVDSYCRRPPVGYGDKCTSNDECSGEATFCETIQSDLCLVPCSAGHTDVCFEGEVCCNFVLFNPICVPSDQCTSMSGTEVK